MGSSTRLTTFSRLADKGDLGVVLGRLMIALNDFGLADEGLKRWSAEEAGLLQDRKTGARMYYVRMLIAHAFEALVVINKIRNDPALLKVVEACDRQTVASFNNVAARIGTAEYKRMRRVRNDVSFHYQDAIVGRATSCFAQVFGCRHAETILHQKRTPISAANAPKSFILGQSGLAYTHVISSLAPAFLTDSLCQRRRLNLRRHGKQIIIRTVHSVGGRCNKKYGTERSGQSLHGSPPIVAARLGRSAIKRQEKTPVSSPARRAPVRRRPNPKLICAQPRGPNHADDGLRDGGKFCNIESSRVSRELSGQDSPRIATMNQPCSPMAGAGPVGHVGNPR